MQKNHIVVECLGTEGQFYPAILKNVTKEEATISYVNKPDIEKTVPLNQLSIVKDAPRNYELRIGMEIEALVSGSDSSSGPFLAATNSGATNGECGSEVAWWPGRLQSRRGDFCVVELIKKRVEIVDRDQMRLPGKRITLSLASFHKHTIQLPKDLAVFASDMALHQDILRHCGAAVISYDEASASLSILSLVVDVIRHVSLLEETHVKMLKQKFALFQSVDHATKRLQSSKQSNRGKFVEEFHVPGDLIGLAIGTHGANIQAARQLPDVLGIDVNDDDCMFTVYAKTEEAALNARKMLEYDEGHVEVESGMVARIIGRNGVNIQQIVDKAGVIRVKIASDGDRGSEMGDERRRRHEDRLDGPETHIDFMFVGTKEAINNARILIDFQVEQIRDLEKMNAERLEIVRELRIAERPSIAGPYDNHPGMYGGGGRGSRGAPYYPDSNGRAGHYQPPPRRGGNRGYENHDIEPLMDPREIDHRGRGGGRFRGDNRNSFPTRSWAEESSGFPPSRSFNEPRGRDNRGRGRYAKYNWSEDEGDNGYRNHYSDQPRGGGNRRREDDGNRRRQEDGNRRGEMSDDGGRPSRGGRGRKPQQSIHEGPNGDDKLGGGEASKKIRPDPGTASSSGAPTKCGDE